MNFPSRFAGCVCVCSPEDITAEWNWFAMNAPATGPGPPRVHLSKIIINYTHWTDPIVKNGQRLGWETKLKSACLFVGLPAMSLFCSCEWEWSFACLLIDLPNNQDSRVNAMATRMAYITSHWLNSFKCSNVQAMDGVKQNKNIVDSYLQNIFTPFTRCPFIAQRTSCNQLIKLSLKVGWCVWVWTKHCCTLVLQPLFWVGHVQWEQIDLFQRRIPVVQGARVTDGSPPLPWATMFVVDGWQWRWWPRWWQRTMIYSLVRRRRRRRWRLQWPEITWKWSNIGTWILLMGGEEEEHKRRSIFIFPSQCLEGNTHFEPARTRFPPSEHKCENINCVPFGPLGKKWMLCHLRPLN